MNNLGHQLDEVEGDDDIDPFADDFEAALSDLLAAEEQQQQLQQLQQQQQQPLQQQAAAAVDPEDVTPSSSRKRKSRDSDSDSSSDGLGIHMKISPPEYEWAKSLKEALAAMDNGALTISDMELVQHGMVERGNVPKALERIRRVHEFRTTYQIQDTPEHGLECIQRFMEQQPGFSLNVDQCPRKKHFVHVVDFAKFFPRRVRLESDWKVFLSGIYYFVTALNPTLAAVRSGNLLIMEGEGMGWDNFCIDFERRLWHEHASAYPFHIYEFSWVNTPSIGNIFFSLLKPILPQAVRDVVQLGVKFDDSFDGRLDELFLQPNVEVATQRQLNTLRSFLEQRYYNQTHFRLPP